MADEGGGQLGPGFIFDAAIRGLVSRGNRGYQPGRSEFWDYASARGSGATDAQARAYHVAAAQARAQGGQLYARDYLRYGVGQTPADRPAPGQAPGTVLLPGTAPILAGVVVALPKGRKRAAALRKARGKPTVVRVPAWLLKRFPELAKVVRVWGRGGLIWGGLSCATDAECRQVVAQWAQRLATMRRFGYGMEVRRVPATGGQRNPRGTRPREAPLPRAPSGPAAVPLPMPRVPAAPPARGRSRAVKLEPVVVTAGRMTPPIPRVLSGTTFTFPSPWTGPTTPAPSPAPAPAPKRFTLPKLPDWLPYVLNRPGQAPQVKLPFMPLPSPPPISSPSSYAAPLTGFQPRVLPSPQPAPKPNACKCESVKRRTRKKGQCRQGYFREFPDRTEYTEWSKRKCPA